MKKLWACGMILGLLALLALPAAAMNGEVKIAEKPGIGKYLTDSKGMTLYWFQNDSVGHSVCTGNCVGNWPIYYREKVAPENGLNAGDFGTITREDGARQTTFRGYPLYYFKGDSKPGDTNGNKLFDRWYVVNPESFPPK
jgi:predicted lipoprotein with Yx(FWY)xxD motif